MSTPARGTMSHARLHCQYQSIPCLKIILATLAIIVITVPLVRRRLNVGAQQPQWLPQPVAGTQQRVSSPPAKYAHVVSADVTQRENRGYDENALTRSAAPIAFASSQSSPNFQLQTTAKVADARPSRTFYVQFYDPPIGLGNKLFQYAAGIGLAKRYGAAPRLVVNNAQVVRALEGLRRVFSLSPLPEQLAEPSPTEVTTLTESSWGRYDAARFDNRAIFEQRDTTAVGYLQSWRYFQSVEDQIRREFSLTPYADAFVNAFLRQSGATERGHVLIGLQVRRGDMGNRPDLYTLAPPAYVLKAVEHYLTKYGGGDDGSTRGLTLIIATNDRRWVEAEVVPILPAKVIAVFTGFAPEEDLAVLSRCNHSVVTAGTYSWWSAWLAGGDVIYYKDFIPPQSALYSGHDPGDYYPPHWLGMS